MRTSIPGPLEGVMKKKFRGYYKPTTEEFEALWDDALIILDANVLLNLYTYSAETWQELLHLLKEMNDRVWLPFQAAAEYHRNRCGIITKEARRYTEILGNLRGVRDALGARKRHPFIDIDLLKQFNELSSTIEDSLQVGEEAHRGLIRDDPICDQVTGIFEGRVGDSLSIEELEKVYAEGAERYAKKTPPGYQDEKKPEPDRYGDLVLWKELIRKSREVDKGVIFVTDETKDDWWFIVADQRIGPRPELLDEFRAEAGHEIYIYGSEMFVDTAKKRGKKISERAVAELEAAREVREIRDRKSAEEHAFRITLAEYEAQQRVIREVMRSPLADYEATQRALRDAMKNPLAEYEAQQRAIRDALMGIKDDTPHDADEDVPAESDDEDTDEDN
jgi:hypothetical protein